MIPRHHMGDMMDIDRDPLVFVSVPVPMYKVRARGREARYSVLATQLKIHFSADDAVLLKREAERAGITFSAFVRWSAVHVAAAMREHYDHVQRPAVDT